MPTKMGYMSTNLVPVMVPSRYLQPFTSQDPLQSCLFRFVLSDYGELVIALPKNDEDYLADFADFLSQRVQLHGSRYLLDLVYEFRDTGQVLDMVIYSPHKTGTA